VTNLRLLGWSIEESLRILSLPMQIRRAPTSMPIPGTDYVIPEGRVVGIVPAVFHMDPESFPDPQTFYPERFKEVISDSIDPTPVTPRSTPSLSPRSASGPEVRQNMIAFFLFVCILSLKFYLMTFLF
jgi:cytochrome P450